VQQSFAMMFYRTDIFGELGVEPPRTWDDFYKVIPVIQRNNMGIGIPASPSVFVTLLLQKGLGLYNEDLSGTMLDKPEAIDAFKQWTGLYTDYSLDLTFDFYNRFRSGEMPLGIASYTFYNQLSVAAPEIRGLWGMLPVPGTEAADGSINKAETADGTACIILKNCKNKEAAWKLLKWWTSDEIQAQYGRELENIMGPAARYDTASKGAFEKLPWSNKESNNLLEQWKYVTEVPELPGSYYTTRCLEFAFRSVTYSVKGKSLKNPREQLYINNRYINEEINRKRIEFGLENSN
jgi:ABC-type glycerol-3-phosphate transport system substrate-binding protein